VISSGIVSIASSTFIAAHTIGGAGGNGGAGAAGGTGGSALGGSLTFINFLDGLVPGTSITDSLTSSTILDASAVGGNAGFGAVGGEGGTAQGGGAALSFETTSGTLSVDVSESIISGNVATGGSGGDGVTGSAGGNGGAAQGGGIFVDLVSDVAISGVVITDNQADGGQGGSGGGDGGTNGGDGSGVGGGVYLSVAGSTKKNTVIEGNSASTSNDDVFGTFS
jgi:hypothetical protein